MNGCVKINEGEDYVASTRNVLDVIRHKKKNKKKTESSQQMIYNKKNRWTDNKATINRALMCNAVFIMPICL